jgi:hypothetical protein
MIGGGDATLRVPDGENGGNGEPKMAKIRAQSLIFAAMLATLFLSTADAAEFVLVNASGVTLYELYIAPCGGPHWGADQLGGVPVLPSRRFTISSLQSGCYDVKVIVPYWNECVISGATLHGRMAWTISPMMLSSAVLGDCSYTEHYVSEGGHPWVGGPQW